jgi:hypothetical protein
MVLLVVEGTMIKRIRLIMWALWLAIQGKDVALTIEEFEDQQLTAAQAAHEEWLWSR